MKIYYPETIDDIELPQAVVWDDIVGSPTSLDDLSPTDGGRLTTVESEVVSGFEDISIQGWSYNATFSATNHNTVAWTAGSIKFKNGETYSISSGNTGVMSSVTYIYIDVSVSETVLQKTTSSANAVGPNKMLIAVAENVTSGKSAVFQAFGGKGGVGVLLTADNIATNSLTANEIQTNTITTLDLTAGSIVGLTITGGTIKTSTGSTRVELNGANNDMRIYKSSILRAQGYENGWHFNNASGTSIGDIYADGTSMLFKASSSSGSMFVSGGALGVASLGIDSTNYFYANGATDENITAKDIMPIGSSVRLGDLGSEFHSVWADTFVTSEILTLGGNIDINGTLEFGSGADALITNGVMEVTAGFVNPAQMTGSVADARSDYRDGSMYYRTSDDVIRVRLNGAWKTITTS